MLRMKSHYPDDTLVPISYLKRELRNYTYDTTCWKEELFQGFHGALSDECIVAASGEESRIATYYHLERPLEWVIWDRELPPCVFVLGAWFLLKKYLA
ncbi:hypothetical protein PSENEW3_00001426 [Picochlorum sp. SENEW3]|nr:hypothetical protein PSENEW3_00001426 [Picochlorum sp. SENEW3]